MPFDEDANLVRNEGGRVLGDDGEPRPGEYASGWIKRGPSGVIGTNKKDSAQTTATCWRTARRAASTSPPSPTGPRRDRALAARARPGLTTWAAWQAIDAHETAAGEPYGRPRVKLTDREELGRVGEGAGAPCG